MSRRRTFPPPKARAPSRTSTPRPRVPDLPPDGSIAAGGAAPVDHGEWLDVTSLDLEAHGVARTLSGKVMFVEGALPGERVTMRIERSKNNWARGPMTAISRQSPQRVEPRCPHFGVCGGCNMQHFDVAAQVAVKQRVLEDTLQHVGKVKPGLVDRPLTGPSWEYRHRARFAVFFLERENRVLLGFHERKSSHVADIAVCPVMPHAASRLIGPLHKLLDSMRASNRIPQIEVAVGSHVVALVLRHLVPLSSSDTQKLKDFAALHEVEWWLQPGGASTVHRMQVDAPLRDGRGDGLATVQRQRTLSYDLPEFHLHMPFRPTDFTQVNPHINAALVGRAVRLLAPASHETVIDWFCGLGNFTLPIAQSARRVLGVEGSRELVDRARDNAKIHGLEERVDVAVCNLFELDPEQLAAFGPADKWLVDPPRDGAFELMKSLVGLVEANGAASFSGFAPPVRIVYVSCDPSTLARDAGLLVHRAGYRCTQAGVVNMFPHTGHVESLVVFDRDC